MFEILDTLHPTLQADCPPDVQTYISYHFRKYFLLRKFNLSGIFDTLKKWCKNYSLNKIDFNRIINEKALINPDSKSIAIFSRENLYEIENGLLCCGKVSVC